jgi:hypothetical protein
VAEYDANVDWVEPKKVYLDDAEVYHPELGHCKAWQAIVWEGVKAKKRLEIRADDASSILRDEDRPPPLAADAAPPEPRIAADIARKLDAAISRLDQRLTRVCGRRVKARRSLARRWRS